MISKITKILCLIILYIVVTLFEKKIISAIRRFLVTDRVHDDREGMETLRKISTKDYPWEYATHNPTGFAQNNAIDSYWYYQAYNKKLREKASNVKHPEPYDICS